MAAEKLTTRLKYKTWTNQQFKNHNGSHELTLIRRYTKHEHPEHMFLKIVNTIYGENCESSAWIQICL